jgi:hypothetical protein
VGEDAPKSVVPSFYGVTPAGKLLFADNPMHDAASEIEVHKVLTGGGVEDWVKDRDAGAKLREYSITSRLTGLAHRAYEAAKLEAMRTWTWRMVGGGKSG